MTRGQYLTMCLIGTVAVIAYLQSYEIAKTLKRSGLVLQPQVIAA